MTWVAPPKQRIQTPFTSPRSGPPELVVVHASVTPWRAPEGTDAARMREWALGKRSRNSAHFLVLRDGRWFQMASLDVATWHAGKSEWRGRRAVNGYSVGVELENVGPLTKVRGHLQNCYGARHLGPVLERAGRWWEPYTAPQYKAAGAIRDALRGALGELEWVGHVDVSPGRKTDPYPSWDWARFGEVAP